MDEQAVTPAPPRLRSSPFASCAVLCCSERGDPFFICDVRWRSQGGGHALWHVKKIEYISQYPEEKKKQSSRGLHPIE